jgi:hypothetical protein
MSRRYVIRRDPLLTERVTCVASGGALYHTALMVKFSFTQLSITHPSLSRFSRNWLLLDKDLWKIPVPNFMKIRQTAYALLLGHRRTCLPIPSSILLLRIKFLKTLWSRILRDTLTVVQLFEKSTPYCQNDRFASLTRTARNKLNLSFNQVFLNVTHMAPKAPHRVSKGPYKNDRKLWGHSKFLLGHWHLSAWIKYFISKTETMVPLSPESPQLKGEVVFYCSSHTLSGSVWFQLCDSTCCQTYAPALML